MCIYPGKQEGRSFSVIPMNTIAGSSNGIAMEYG